MKAIKYFLLLSILLSSGCNSTSTKSVTNINSLATLAFNIDEVHLRSVDGKPFNYKPGSLFSSNKLKVSPGKHVAAVTLHWGSSLNGRSFSIETNKNLKHICFNAEPNKSYVIIAKFDKAGEWFPIVMERISLFRSREVSSC